MVSVQLGVNIQLSNIRWFGMEEKETVKKILSLPFQHVRIPIPMNEVMPTSTTWEFEKRDWLIEQAQKYKKTIHLQLGMKTIGYPEFRVPEWLQTQFPSIHKPGIVGQEEALQEHVLSYVETSLRRYASVKQLASLHIENEAFSKRLQVTHRRSLSHALYEKEYHLVKKYNKRRLPLVQNFPYETPEAIAFMLSHCDIIGLNIYPQYNPLPFPDEFIWHFKSLLLQSAGTFSPLIKKKIWITEYQTAPWITDRKVPVHPFYEDLFFKGFNLLKKANPEIVFLWDVEQVLWKTKITTQDYLLKAITEFVKNQFYES